MKKIYLDNAAATPIDPRVVRAMAEAAAYFGNPSSFNDAGRTARGELEKARHIIAGFLGARPDEIVFTDSGSEANNLAILGTMTRFGSGRIVTTPIEHPSVLGPLRKLPKLKIGYLKVDSSGRIDVSGLEKTLTPGCRMISVMYANNEIGTIEPIRKIGRMIGQYRNKKSSDRPLFHVDACQAAGYLDMNVQRLGADLLTFNGSKIYGPHGIGALYIRRGTPIQPLIIGGGQEHGLRAGTENLQAIIGFAKAVTLIGKNDTKTIALIRDYAIAQLQKKLPGIILNGPIGDERLANNINICIPGLESEAILLELDKYGISAGSGSACTAHSVEPSHVLKAIGVPAKYINGALRFSLGRDTTKADMDRLVGALERVFKDLRRRYQNKTTKAS